MTTAYELQRPVESAARRGSAILTGLAARVRLTCRGALRDRRPQSRSSEQPATACNAAPRVMLRASVQRAATGCLAQHVLGAVSHGLCVCRCRACMMSSRMLNVAHAGVAPPGGACVAGRRACCLGGGCAAGVAAGCRRRGLVLSVPRLLLGARSAGCLACGLASRRFSGVARKRKQIVLSGAPGCRLGIAGCVGAARVTCHVARHRTCLTRSKRIAPAA